MKKKRALQVIGVGLLGAMLVGCSAEETGGEEVTETETTETEEVEEEDVSTEVETEEETEEVAEENQAGTRTEPLNVGDTGVINLVKYKDDEDFTEVKGVADITISNIVRGESAIPLLTTEYSTPEEPAEGMEWVVFDSTFVLTDTTDDNESFSISEDFTVIKEDGSGVEKSYIMFDGMLEFPEIYSGGTATGKVAVQAPVGESFIIKYDDMMDAEAYFKVD